MIPPGGWFFFCEPVQMMTDYGGGSRSFAMDIPIYELIVKHNHGMIEQTSENRSVRKMFCVNAEDHSCKTAEIHLGKHFCGVEEYEKKNPIAGFGVADAAGVFAGVRNYCGSCRSDSVSG
jgi:hypothetical protein